MNSTQKHQKTEPVTLHCSGSSGNKDTLKYSSGSIRDESAGQHPLSIILAVHGNLNQLPAFTHALCLTCTAKGELQIVDARKGRNMQSDLNVRRTFEQWRKLPAGSKREDVGNTGARIKKIAAKGNIKKEIGKRLEKDSCDILIMATETRKGINHLFGQDIIDFLARSFRQTTLYIPDKAKPFANSETGQLSLKKILIPVSEEPSPEPSFEMLHRIMNFSPETSPDVIGIHKGECFPYISGSYLNDISWREINEIPENESIWHLIARRAESEKVDLIIMSTNGRDTLPQKIMGSITENVVGLAPCPVLAVVEE